MRKSPHLRFVKRKRWKFIALKSYSSMSTAGDPSRPSSTVQTSHHLFGMSPCWAPLQITTGESSNDLVKAVDNLLNNLGPKFSKVSADLFAKSKSNVTALLEMLLSQFRSGRNVPKARRYGSSHESRKRTWEWGCLEGIYFCLLVGRIWKDAVWLVFWVYWELSRTVDDRFEMR